MKRLLLTLAAATALCACDQKVNFGLPETSNSFSQSVAYNNKVDIIWVMDNSSSMQKYQTTLSAQVPGFIQKLNDAKLDYHMGVITTSMGSGGNGGRLLGSSPYLTNSTPNVAQALSNLLIVGQSGDNLNRGLDSILNVLSSSYMNGAGAGFIREDAYLAVVILSDGNDYSARNQADVISYIDQVKPAWIDGTRSWNVNYLGMIVDSPACRTLNNYSDVGTVWNGLADATNGVKESICSPDYSVVVGDLRARIMQILTDYKLNKIPVLSSIAVSINGQPVPQDGVNGWTYESSGNLIRFHGSYVPAADASIKVDFTPAEAN